MALQPVLIHRVAKGTQAQEANRIGGTESIGSWRGRDAWWLGRGRGHVYLCAWEGQGVFQRGL